ncbi:MAG: 50S ribosomal protein L1 [Candidatus Cloacimonetes bacterium]|nr:50S ribosomal protein L1 [Candidatus Cloacimonadota bacterium]MBL7085593.1 50S ribosomal protein L1 [Candidatus Cloacimonadota bacterium]
MKKSKRYLQESEKIDKAKSYQLNQAIELLKQLGNTKFDETVEIHLRIGVDPQKANQVVRGTVILPNGTGKAIKVLVFAEGDKAEEAKNAGADFVGMDNLAEKIQNGWTDFDIAIATPNMMKNIGKLAKILGPRKLMPNPKTGTITMDIENAVKESKAGKIEYRIDKSANMHIPVGKISFEIEKIYENISTLMKAVVRDKPASAKGKYIKNMTLCSTMSPAIKIDSISFLKEIQTK